MFDELESVAACKQGLQTTAEATQLVGSAPAPSEQFAIESSARFWMIAYSASFGSTPMQLYR
jgi:hypothetical protein